MMLAVPPLATARLAGGSRGVTERHLWYNNASPLDVEFSQPKLPLVQGWGLVDYACLDNWIF
jgi:hypothetical protein